MGSKKSAAFTFRTFERHVVLQLGNVVAIAGHLNRVPPAPWTVEEVGARLNPQVLGQKKRVAITLHWSNERLVVDELGIVVGIPGRLDWAPPASWTVEEVNGFILCRHLRPMYTRGRLRPMRRGVRLVVVTALRPGRTILAPASFTIGKVQHRTDGALEALAKVLVCCASFFRKLSDFGLPRGGHRASANDRVHRSLLSEILVTRISRRPEREQRRIRHQGWAE